MNERQYPLPPNAERRDAGVIGRGVIILGSEGRITMLMSVRLILIGVALSAVILPTRATHRDLSYPTAKTIAETAIESCRTSGYFRLGRRRRPCRRGHRRIARRQRQPAHDGNARRKAYTARSFRTSTTAYAKRFADNDPVVRQQVTLPNRNTRRTADQS